MPTLDMASKSSLKKMRISPLATLACENGDVQNNEIRICSTTTHDVVHTLAGEVANLAVGVVEAGEDGRDDGAQVIGDFGSQRDSVDNRTQ